MSNNQSLTTPLNSAVETGMDFKELVKQGVDIIQKLSGESGTWTNYNISDPGITILEHLCYAITDLSYRLSFPVQDLLAEDIGVENTQAGKKILFLAKEILTVTPLTVNDYRKLLIDIPEIKNAWIEVVTEPLQFQGLYKASVEARTYGTEKENEVIIAQVKHKLRQHRNLCEDFHEIILLKPQEISIEADIELKDNINIVSLKEKIYRTVEQIISPEVPFYSLEELRAQGKSVEEIYDGPVLEHGFINDEDLKRFDKKSVIYAADIIEALHKIQVVKIVRKLLLNNSEEVIPNLNHNVFCIKEFKVNFYKNGYLTLEDKKITVPIRTPRQIKNMDWILPTGKYRNLVTYDSIQKDLPHNYLLGPNNIPDSSVDSKRKISSKQLKSYLLIFDQILANYFANVNGIKTSFNYIKELEETEQPDSKNKASIYSSQPVNCSEIELLVHKHYKEELIALSQEQSETNRYIRKNRLLDYLLAIFGQTFKDYSASSKKESNTDKALLPEQKLINKKIAFLTNYPKLSGLRGKAINYTMQDVLEGSEARVCSLHTSISNIFEIAEDDCYFIEHILLRPFAPEQKGICSIINDINFYDHNISFILPKEKVLNTFETDVEKKIQEVLRNEAPAHIKVYYHMWDTEKITQFREYYDAWLSAYKNDSDLWIDSMVIGDGVNDTKNYYYFRVFDGADLNTLSVYSFIVAKILCGIQGIGSMVIGDGIGDAKNYYYFKVFDGIAPLITTPSLAINQSHYI